MPPKRVGAGYWLLPAEEARDTAAQMTDEQAQQARLKIAAQYETLGRHSASLAKYQDLTPLRPYATDAKGT